MTVGQRQQILLTEDKTVKNYISIIAGISCDDVDKLTDKSYNELFHKLNAELNPPDSTVNTVIEINGVKYGLIDFDKITLAKRINLSTYRAEFEKNIHKILNEIYIRQDAKSNSNGEDNAKEFLQADWAKVYPTFVFFSNIGKEVASAVSEILKK